MDAGEPSRQSQLHRERQIQVKREGVSVVFHRGTKQSYCHFQLDHHNVEVVSEWLGARTSINVYSSTGWKQLFLIGKSAAQMYGDRLYIRSRHPDHLFCENQCYILAKNNATIEILKTALDSSYQADPEIHSFINNPETLQISSNKAFELEEWAYHELNEPQRRAIELVTSQKITYIKGPPGCGKTKTIARLATIFSFRGLPMLIGAVSNTANMAIARAILQESKEMDYTPNLVLFISKQSQAENALHPPEIRCLTFRYKVIQKFLLLNQFENALEQVEAMLDHFWAGYATTNSFISVYYQAVAQVFLEVCIVIATTTSATKMDTKLSEQQKFKPYIGVLDEASQASWADTCCFLNKGVQKMVLIGDDKQLAPTVISQNEALKETVFTKTFQKNPKYYVLLNRQYRMHPAIAQFPNQQFYNGQLEDGVTAAERQSPIPYFQKFPVSFINCEGEEQEEVEQSGKRNFCNWEETELVRKVLTFFSREHYSSIGIISPYDLQIRSIRAAVGEQLFSQGLTARTCDGYQGGEKEHIIVSCVRSNKEGKIGFCGEQSRLNVTLTRARRGIVVIGNKETLSAEKGESNIWIKYFTYLSQRNLILHPNELQKHTQ